ncbi:MAG TPA: hypothetical protein VJP02_03550 [Candidatus Sulfotelmatobacter sp.]|nr:hypothetical protein [Candidatus Sulfotelmatobacter sp.]
MHDFRKLIAPHRKQDPREKEIVGELACHLEEMYTDLRNRGASDESALAVVSTAGKNLGPTIRRLRWESEDGLRTWVRAVMLPGLILALFYGVCNIALGIYWEYPSLWREAGLVLVSVALGFCASSFSRELGGRKVHRLWAAAVVIFFQAGAECTMIFVVTPMQLSRGSQYLNVVFWSLLYILLWDVVVPSVALVIGGLISMWAFPSQTRPMTLKKTTA